MYKGLLQIHVGPTPHTQTMVSDVRLVRLSQRAPKLSQGAPMMSLGAPKLSQGAPTFFRRCNI